MDEKLNKIDEKLDLLSARMASIDVTIAKQQTSLEEHIRRSDLLEIQVDELRKFIYTARGGIAILSTVLVLIEIISKCLK